MEPVVYLDYAATTPIDERVIAAMQPYFSVDFGNPSSVHRYGQRAEAAVEAARESVAKALGCAPGEVLFTSCGTESDNLALRGAALAAGERSGADHIVTSRTEHHAVSKTAEQLSQLHGCVIDWLDVTPEGVVRASEVQAVLTTRVAIVSVMYANNEIGTVNPIQDIATACRSQGVLFHTDAVQAAAYLPVDVSELGVDLLSLGGHKFYGPKGVRALYVRKGVSLMPAQTGGAQEGGLRAGTQNVPLIVGFARALELAVEEREIRTTQAVSQRDHIIGAVLEHIPDAVLTGSPRHRLPNHASFAFQHVDGNLLLSLLDSAGYACSSGSACKVGNPEPSEVLSSLGLEPDWSLGSLRVTVGRGTTAQEVDRFLKDLPDIVERARALSISK